MTQPSEAQASQQTKRIHVSGTKSYHGAYSCKALAAARRRLAGEWNVKRVRGFRELRPEQVEARGLKACPWCHGTKPGPRASSTVSGDASSQDPAATDPVLEVRQLVWPASLHRALAEAVSGAAVKA